MSKSTTNVSTSGKNQVSNYTLKIINRAKKSQYQLKPLQLSCHHHSLSDFRKRVEDEIGTIEGMIGYVEPGHGQKGKQREISDDEDLMEMYIIHRSKHDILWWSCGDVEGQDLSSVRKSRKRPHSNEFKHVSAPPNKRDSIAKILSEVEIAIKELKNKHGDTYPIEKLNAWAHL